MPPFLTFISLGLLVGIARTGPLVRNSTIGPRQEDTWRRNPDLSKFPSVKNTLTLYRGISNSEELKSTRDRLGKSPEYTSISYGDFNADGSAVLYFFSGNYLFCSFRNYPGLYLR